MYSLVHFYEGACYMKINKPSWDIKYVCASVLIDLQITCPFSNKVDFRYEYTPLKIPLFVEKDSKGKEITPLPVPKIVKIGCGQYHTVAITDTNKVIIVLRGCMFSILPSSKLRSSLCMSYAIHKCFICKA